LTDNFDHITQLVQQVQLGDKKAFEELFHLFSKSMLNTAYRIVKDQDLAHDVLQESFVKVYTKIQALKDPKGFAKWLKTITINQALSYVKWSNRHELSENEISYESNEKDWYMDIPFQIIERAIMQLPKKCRIIFSLYALEGLRHQEIAKYLNVSESTSKSQYAYGLKLLKQSLSKWKSYEI